MGNAFTTLARTFKGGQGPKPARAYLVPLDAFDGDSALDGETRTFQYFPATVSDTHATNYQTKVIPGLSHPLYQWTSGGARTISFEAVFSRDRTYTDGEREDLSSFGGIHLSSLGKPSLGPGRNPVRGTLSNKNPRDVDIPSAVAWLKSFTLPEYSIDGNGTHSSTPGRPKPPRKLILGMPGLRLNWGVPSLPPTEVFCILKGCAVSYQAFFHDGTPRLAKVALSFLEIIQIGGRIVVQDAGDRRSYGLGGYTLNDQKESK
jgi:hypothetical protein